MTRVNMNTFMILRLCRTNFNKTRIDPIVAMIVPRTVHHHKVIHKYSSSITKKNKYVKDSTPNIYLFSVVMVVKIYLTMYENLLSSPDARTNCRCARF